MLRGLASHLSSRRPLSTGSRTIFRRGERVGRASLAAQKQNGRCTAMAAANRAAPEPPADPVAVVFLLFLLPLLPLLIILLLLNLVKRGDALKNKTGLSKTKNGRYVLLF